MDAIRQMNNTPRNVRPLPLLLPSPYERFALVSKYLRLLNTRDPPTRLQYTELNTLSYIICNFA